MIVVSDTSPITNLAAIGRLDLLRRLYERVYLPGAVFEELAYGGTDAGAIEVAAADWIARREPARRSLVADLLGELDAGEGEAIALALELDADLLLIDERAGRAVAARLGLHRVGLLGVLLEAKGRGFVPAVRPLMDALRAEADFWIGASLYREMLRLAHE